VEKSKESRNFGNFVSNLGQRARSTFQPQEATTTLRDIGNHLKDSSNQAGYSCVGVSGFISKDSNLIKAWQPLHEHFPDANSYVLEWNAGSIFQIGMYLSTAFINRKLVSLIPDSANSSSPHEEHRVGALRHFDKAINNKYVDYGLGSLNNSLENFLGTWEKSRRYAQNAGEELANAISKGTLGEAPLILIGADLGTEVIFSALTCLSKEDCTEKVSTVMLLGSTIMPNEAIVSEAIKSVSGTVFNLYSSQDVFLKYLAYRNEYKGILLGLGKLEGFVDVVNIDLTPEIGIDHFKYERELGNIFLRFSKRVKGQL